MPNITFSQEMMEILMRRIQTNWGFTGFSLFQGSWYDGSGTTLWSNYQLVTWRVTPVIESTDPPKWTIDFNNVGFSAAQHSGTATWWGLHQDSYYSSSFGRYMIGGSVSGLGGGGDIEIAETNIVSGTSYKMLGIVSVTQPKVFTY